MNDERPGEVTTPPPRFRRAYEAGRAAERARIAAEIRELPCEMPDGCTRTDHNGDQLLTAAAVLAIIEEEK